MQAAPVAGPNEKNEYPLIILGIQIPHSSNLTIKVSTHLDEQGLTTQIFERSKGHLQ